MGALQDSLYTATAATNKQTDSTVSIFSDNAANVCQTMDNETDTIKTEITKYINTSVTSTGHIYPVAMVQSWTKEMQGYNAQLKGYIEMFKKLDLSKVDRYWLKKQVQKFVSWINERLAKLRQKIVKSLKSMYSKVQEVLEVVTPIIKLAGGDLGAVVSWIGNVINLFLKPYQKIITFIKDFATYTPPLVAECMELTSTVAFTPSIIQSKAAELTGQGADIIIEEIQNTVSGITFSPISIGDLQ